MVVVESEKLRPIPERVFLHPMHSESHSSANRKLVFLDPVGGKTLGGGEMVAAEVLAALASRGWDITLVTPPNSGLSGDVDLQGKVEILPLELNTERQGKAALIKALWRIYQLGKQKPDAVWYGNTYRSLKWLAWAKLMGDVRTVCHLHESHYGPYYWMRTRVFAALMDAFICISETVKRELAAGTGRRNIQSRVIYNGIHILNERVKDGEEVTQIREKLSLAPGPLICLVGRSDPLKGHDVFLQAAKRINDRIPEVRFLIVGGHWDEPGHNPFESEMRELCHSLALDGVVKFFPHSEDARLMMRCADVVVVPSRSEGFGRVAIEAMSEQTPLIASKVGGLAEIISHREDGLLIAPDDADALAEAVVFLLKNPDEREYLVKNARRKVATQFSQAAMVDKIEELLFELS